MFFLLLFVSLDASAYDFNVLFDTTESSKPNVATPLNKFNNNTQTKIYEREVELYNIRKTFFPPVDSNSSNFENSADNSSSELSSPSDNRSSSRSLQPRRGVKNISSNGRVSGVTSYRVNCTGGSDYVIYEKSGSWRRGDIGSMGAKYNGWSKERLAEYLCR